MDTRLPEVRASRLVIEDGAGRARVVISVDAAGAPSLAMLDQQGSERVRIELREDPGDEHGSRLLTTASAWLTASDGGSAVSLIAGPDGSGSVEVCSDEQDLRASCLLEISSDEGGQARVALYDRQLRAQWRVEGGEVAFDTARPLP